MNRTKIEWVKNPDGSQGYTWNPITGCLNGCPYCYARKLANGRLKQRYLANPDVAPRYEEDGTRFNRYEDLHDPFYPRFWPERIPDDKFHYLGKLKQVKPRGIFVCDMGELFSDWIPQEWQEQIFRVITLNPWHRFYLLTHQPQELHKFSPFPENCWVGVTATDHITARLVLDYFTAIEAPVKFLSIEPLLDDIMIKTPVTIRDWEILDWIIIGAMTGTKKGHLKLNSISNSVLKKYPDLTLMPYGKIWTLQPELMWVKRIVEAADYAGVKVFLKDNLTPLLEDEPFYKCEADGDWRIRQEMPK